MISELNNLKLHCNINKPAVTCEEFVYQRHTKLINVRNRCKYTIIIIDRQKEESDTKNHTQIDIFKKTVYP